MANAILKITTFRRNIRMGKINRSDPILLKWDYSYLIETKLRIFYLIFQIYSENLLDFSFLNILSNENFGFLLEDKKYLKNNNTEDISLDITISNNNDDNNDDNDDENTVEFISTILDDQLNLNDQLKVSILLLII
jgi:hypothetical protein